MSEVQPRHPDTTALTLMIHSAKLQDGYERVASAIDALLWRYTDETKADLYARIQDSVLETDTFSTMEEKINRALWANMRTFV